MATTGPDSVSSWKNIGGYDIYDDKKKRKNQNQKAQNNLQKAAVTTVTVPKSNSTYTDKNSGGKSSAVSSYNKNNTSSNKTAGVFDSIKLPYEDTVAQKNAQKAADLKRQQEKYNAEKLAQKQAAEAKAVS